MEREQRELTTPNGHKVVVKEYLTAREMRAVEAVYAEGAKFDLSGQPNIEGMNGTIVQKAQDELIKQVVVSVNGQTDKCLDALLDLRKEDFDFVIKEVDQITAPNTDKKKAE